MAKLNVKLFVVYEVQITLNQTVSSQSQWCGSQENVKKGKTEPGSFFNVRLENVRTRQQLQDECAPFCTASIFQVQNTQAHLEPYIIRILCPLKVYSK